MKNHRDMKVTVIPIVIGALATVTKGLIKGPEELEIRGRVETIKATVLLRSARILTGVLETRGEENEKRDKYLNIAREQKKPVEHESNLERSQRSWKRKLKELEIGGRIETIQTTELLRSSRILRGVLETWENLLSLRLQWKTIS